MVCPGELASVATFEVDAMQWRKTQNLTSGGMQWVYSDRQREEMMTIATMGRWPFATKI